MDSPNRDRKQKNPLTDAVLAPLIAEINQKLEDRKMTKTLRIEGMMCPHCEARVKNALEAVEGVTGAVADHKLGTAVVTLAKDVEDAVLKSAVEAQDYPVLGIE